MTRRTGHGSDRAERLYGCWRCGQRKPRRAFDLGPKGRQLSRVCRDCWHREAEQRRARQTARKLANGITVKRCSNCWRWKPRDQGFAVWKRWPDGRPRYWNAWCNTCLAERQRINYALRAEREGRTVKPYRGARQAPYREPGGNSDLSVPVEPLQVWLRTVLERELPELDGHDHELPTREAFAASLRIDSRALWRIEHGEYRTVSVGLADQLLTNYGRPVVIRARDLERGLVEWAQEQPGNGTRLLRYIDRAETVAHLADRSLLFLADLWPELDA